MQDPRFLERCIEDIRRHFNTSPLQIIAGDRYCPVLAIRLNDVVLPSTVVARTADITVPFARCAGYLPGSTLAGVHLHSGVHSLYKGEQTIIPFCDPVDDTHWLESTKRFYPLYEQHQAGLLGSSYLCLNDPAGQTESPLVLLQAALRYLGHWQDHAFSLAKHHGAVARGVRPGDRGESADWVEHLVEHASPVLKADLLSASRYLVNIGF